MPCACGQHKTPQACAGARTLAMPGVRHRNTPTWKPRATKKNGPLCACGCGRRCYPRCTYASPACVPIGVRTAAMRAGWRRTAEMRRTLRFRADIERLVGASGGRITRQDLIVFAETIDRRAYDRGLKARKAAA